MTDGLICDRCGTAVPEEEWKKHANATIMFGYLEEGSTGEYERGPVEAHLCGECTQWIDEQFGGMVPSKWTRWPEESGDE